MEKLIEFQKQVEAIKKDAKNPFFKSSYFDINSLLSAIKPTLNELGLVLLQPLTHYGEKPALRTILLDGNKELINDLIILPELSDPQKMGSAITYYRRYAIQSLLALQAEDDDGNLASGKELKDYGKENVIPKMVSGMARAVNVENKKKDIKIFIDNNSPIKPETKEDYENACLDQFGIELKPENFDEILKVINNN